MAEDAVWPALPGDLAGPGLITRLNVQVGRALDVLAMAGRSEVRDIAASATVALSHRQLVVRADASGGAVVVTLPRVRSVAERRVTVKRVSSGSPVTVAASSGETIDGAATVVLTTQWETLRLVADAAHAGWLTI